MLTTGSERFKAVLMRKITLLTFIKQGLVLGKSKTQVWPREPRAAKQKRLTRSRAQAIPRQAMWRFEVALGLLNLVIIEWEGDWDTGALGLGGGGGGYQ